MSWCFYLMCFLCWGGGGWGGIYKLLLFFLVPVSFFLDLGLALHADLLRRV